MKSIILIACILAYAVAQQPTIVHLTNGTTVSGSLGVSSSSQLATETVDRYAFPIPANVDVLTIHFDADPTSNSPCSYLYYYYSVSTIPCGNLWDAAGATFLPCQHTTYDSAYAAETITLYAGSSSFEPGATLYFTVSKQGAYYDDVCPYTVTIGNSNCTTSQVGVYVDFEPTCLEVTDHTFPAAWDASVAADSSIVYRFPVSELTGNVHIEINSTDSLYAYGGYNAPYDSSSADCYEYSSEGTLGLTCGQPKNGWFYLTVKNPYGSAVDASISVSSLPCAADAGGVWCQHFAHNYTDSTPVNRTIRAFNSSIDSNNFYPGDFYYVNFPAGALANVNFTVCNGETSLYVTYRKDGFPFYNSHRNSLNSFACLTVVLRPEDTYIGGTYVVGVLNPSSTTVATYQISKAAASFDTTTAGQTTEGEPSGAAALVAPVVMVFAMLALLF